MRFWGLAITAAATVVACVPLDGLAGEADQVAEPTRANQGNADPTSPETDPPVKPDKTGTTPAPSSTPTTPTKPSPTLLARVDFEDKTQQTFPGFVYSRAPLADKFSGSVISSTKVALELPIAPRAELFASFRFRLDANPPSGPVVFEAADTAGTTQLRFEIGVTNNGLKVFRAGDNNLIGLNPQLLVGSTYRIDVHMKSGIASQLEVALTQGTAKPLVVVNVPFATATLPFAKLGFGNLSNQPLSATFDDIVVSPNAVP